MQRRDSPKSYATYLREVQPSRAPVYPGSFGSSGAEVMTMEDLKKIEQELLRQKRLAMEPLDESLDPELEAKPYRRSLRPSTQLGYYEPRDEKQK